VGDYNDDARFVLELYMNWQGNLRGFLPMAAQRSGMNTKAIRMLLVIAGFLAPSKARAKRPRYRGATKKCQPGAVLVTDGMEIQVISSHSGETDTFVWQGIVDQNTACHTAVVITTTECAAGVRQAFDESTTLLGRPPQALVHDNKPIHDDRALRAHIEETTIMIPATPATPENKAVIEGEFGKFAQTFGPIVLDDSSIENLKKSAAREVVRAYTTGQNHAGRVEYNGKSRIEQLKKHCLDPEKDKAFLVNLHADHTQKSRRDYLPTKAVVLELLNVEFVRCNIEHLDPKSETRNWLAESYTPEAIRRGLAIFTTELEKGRLRNDTAHRYLVKVIQSQQQELDLRSQETKLREYAEIERTAWLKPLDLDYTDLVATCNNSSPDKDLAFAISEKAVFGGMIIQRAFWEKKLTSLLEQHKEHYRAVCNHIRRLLEAPIHDRFDLISKLVSGEMQIAR